MNRLIILMLLGALLHSSELWSQQSQDFGDYVVHYSAVTADLIPPDVARSYGLTRSPNQAVLNISVLEKNPDAPGKLVRASVSANATNLTGQLRDLEIREIVEPSGAVYYVSEFPVHHRETYTFDITVERAGEDVPMELSFREQFFTE